MSKDENLLKSVLPYVLVSYILMAVILLVISLLYFIIPFSEGELSVTTTIITIILLFTFAKFIGKNTKQNKAIYGGVYGGLFAFIMVVLGVCSKNIVLFSIGPVIYVLAGFLIGVIGGTFGSYSKRKRRDVR